MQSLPVLVLAALAAFAPNAYASSHDCTSPSYTGNRIDPGTVLPPEILCNIAERLPVGAQGSLLRTNQENMSVVVATRDAEFRASLRGLFKKFDANIPAETIQSLVAATKSSGSKQNIPLSSFVTIVGPTMLQAKPELAKELVRLALTSDQDPMSLVTHGAKVGPRILLELARATGPSDEINRIFDLNAEQLNGGLGIDKTWIGDFLNWFMAALKSKNLPPTIQASRDDLSRMWCFQIYSALDPRMLTDQFKWTANDVAPILDRMHMPADTFFFAKSVSERYPSLQILLQLKPGLLVDDSGKFDIQAGFEACFERPPKAFAILDNLQSRLNGQKLADDPMIKASILDIFKKSLSLTGMDTRDMWSALTSWKVTEGLIKDALNAMCGDSNDGPGCLDSLYYQQAPDHGVLGWGTLSQLLGKLFDLKHYKSARWLLYLLSRKTLLPAHITHLFISSTMDILWEAKDGEELDENGRKARDYIFEKHRRNED